MSFSNSEMQRENRSLLQPANCSFIERFQMAAVSCRKYYSLCIAEFENDMPGVANVQNRMRRDEARRALWNGYANLRFIKSWGSAIDYELPSWVHFYIAVRSQAPACRDGGQMTA